jgi:hypothetical protein
MQSSGAGGALHLKFGFADAKIVWLAAWPNPCGGPVTPVPSDKPLKDDQLTQETDLSLYAE